jgi:hypothetical protein
MLQLLGPLPNAFRTLHVYPLRDPKGGRGEGTLAAAPCCQSRFLAPLQERPRQQAIAAALSCVGLLRHQTYSKHQTDCSLAAMAERLTLPPVGRLVRH